MEKNKKKRGRPTILTPDIERLIASRVSADQEKPPGERTARKVFAHQIQQEIAQWNEELPQLSTLEKRISHYRSIPKQPFDELWTLGSLVEHPIPPEALPIVMSIYRKALVGKDELTIRQAQWIGRLYKVVDSPELVWDWAWGYALAEWLSEITSNPFDTTKLDLELLANPQYATEQRRITEREIAIWIIAEEYGADPVKLKDLNLSIEETEEIAKSGKYKKAKI